MAAILEWAFANDIIEEPFSNTANTPYTMTITNTGTNSANGVGFFLIQASVEGDIDNPSSEGIVSDWYDALVKGNAGPYGMRISQDNGSTYTSFSFSNGDSSENPIMLTIGSGDDSSNIAPGESVELVFRYVPEPGDLARRLYIEVELTYLEI